MTSKFYDKAIERDDALIKGLCQAARTTRMELRDWAETELRDVLVAAELQESIVGGEIGGRIKSTVERLRITSHRDLPEAVRDYDDVMDEVFRGGSTDVNDAYDQLQKGCSGLVRIIGELLDIRSFIGDMGDA